jgi:phenylalanine ammonia-lyase
MNGYVGSLNQFAERFSKEFTKLAENSFYPNFAIPPSAVATQLGDGTSQLYTWVRSKLGVPTHFGIADDPLYNAKHGLLMEDKKTIGSWVSLIYESVKGPFLDMVMDGLESSYRGPRDSEDFEELCERMKKME